MMPPAPTRTPQRRAADGLTFTERFVIATVMSWVLMEFYLAATGQQLISQAIWRLGKKYPWVNFGGGGFAFHFFVDMKEEADKDKGRE